MYLSLSLKHPVNVDRMLIDGTKCELLTFGYNPAGARKRQITIFLAVSEGENIPVHLALLPQKAWSSSRKIRL